MPKNSWLLDRAEFARLNRLIRVEDEPPIPDAAAPLDLPKTPCWTWQGNQTSNGYGKWQRGPGHTEKAVHRTVYQHYKNEMIPKGLQLDHRTAGSVGGKDNPKNWIWISTATNQTKGGYEAAAKKIKGTAAEKEAFIKTSLIGGLKANSKMTSAQVAEVKAKGAAAVIAKSEGAANTRKVLPTMAPADRNKLISTSTGPKLKEMLKASVAEGKNPVTGRPTSYRPVLSGGDGARVRKDYGTTPQMKALLKARWGEPLTSADKKALGQMLNASTGSNKSSSQKLDETFGNFPPASPISAKDRADILSNAS